MTKTAALAPTAAAWLATVAAAANFYTNEGSMLFTQTLKTQMPSLSMIELDDNWPDFFDVEAAKEIVLAAIAVNDPTSFSSLCHIPAFSKILKNLSKADIMEAVIDTDAEQVLMEIGTEHISLDILLLLRQELLTPESQWEYLPRLLRIDTTRILEKYLVGLPETPQTQDALLQLLKSSFRMKRVLPPMAAITHALDRDHKEQLTTLLIQKIFYERHQYARDTAFPVTYWAVRLLNIVFDMNDQMMNIRLKTLNIQDSEKLKLIVSILTQENLNRIDYRILLHRHTFSCLGKVELLTELPEIGPKITRYLQDPMFIAEQGYDAQQRLALALHFNPNDSVNNIRLGLNQNATTQQLVEILSTFGITLPDRQAETVNNPDPAPIDSSNDQQLDALLKHHQFDVPDHFYCPITFQVMSDPAIVQGSTYQRPIEKTALLAWIGEVAQHPMTRETHTIDQIITSPELINEINHFVQGAIRYFEKRKAYNTDHRHMLGEPSKPPFLWYWESEAAKKALSQARELSDQGRRAFDEQWALMPTTISSNT